MINFILRHKFSFFIAVGILALGWAFDVNIKKTFLAEVKNRIPFGDIEFFDSQKMYQSSDEVAVLEGEPLSRGGGVYVFEEIYNAERFNLKETFYFRGDYYKVIKNPSLFVGFESGGSRTRSSIFYGTVVKKIR